MLNILHQIFFKFSVAPIRRLNPITLNLTFDLFIPLYLIGGGGGWVIISTLFLPLKTIEKVTKKCFFWHGKI